MSFIYPKTAGRERTYIKEKVKSRDKYTCSKILYNPADMTDYDSFWEFGYQSEHYVANCEKVSQPVSKQI